MDFLANSTDIGQQSTDDILLLSGEIAKKVLHGKRDEVSRADFSYFENAVSTLLTERQFASAHWRMMTDSEKATVALWSEHLQREWKEERKEADHAVRHEVKKHGLHVHDVLHKTHSEDKKKDGYSPFQKTYAKEKEVKVKKEKKELPPSAAHIEAMKKKLWLAVQEVLEVRDIPLKRYRRKIFHICKQIKQTETTADTEKILSDFIETNVAVTEAKETKDDLKRRKKMFQYAKALLVVVGVRGIIPETAAEKIDQRLMQFDSLERKRRK